MAYGGTSAVDLAGPSAQTQLLADAQWSQLQNDLSANMQSRISAPNPASYVSEADKYRDFYTRYPNVSQASTARCNEALALIAAGRYGDFSNSVRCASAVASLRKDKAVPELQRYRVAAAAEALDVTTLELHGTDATQAMENLQKKLIEEFPALPNGYEGLLHVAEETEPQSGARLAGELRKMDKAPEQIRKSARILETRYGLLGKSFRDLAVPLVGSFAGLDASGGHPVVLYSWSIASPYSLKMGKALAATAAPGTLLIAISTDFDQKKIQAAVQKEGVPGYVYCDGKGGLGAFATALELREPGRAYLVDSEGRFVSVQLHLDRSVQGLALGQR